MTAITSFHVRPPIAAAYSTASAGCPLAHQSRVTSVWGPQYIRTCCIVISPSKAAHNKLLLFESC